MDRGNKGWNNVLIGGIMDRLMGGLSYADKMYKGTDMTLCFIKLSV